MFNVFKNSAKRRVYLSAAVIISVILAMFIFAMFYCWEFKKSTSEANHKYMLAISKQRADSIDNRISQDIKALSTIGSIVSYHSNMDKAHIVNLLKEEMNNNDSFVRMGLAEVNGDAITTDGYKINIYGEKHFTDAMNGKVSVGDVLKDKINGDLINVYSVPIYSGHKVKYVLFGTIKNSEYKEILDFPVFIGSGDTYLANSKGETFADLDTKPAEFPMNNVFTDLKYNDKVAAIVKSDFENGRSNIVTHSTKGPNYLIYSPLKVNSWFVVSTTPKIAVVKNTIQFFTFSIITATVVILLFLSLFIYISVLLKRHSEKMEEFAYVDEITGGHTWNYFKTIAPGLISMRAEKNALVLIDIKKSQVINDVFGLKLGNQTLKYVYSEIENILKVNELCCRCSGDVFVAFMRCKDKEDLLTRLQELSKNLSEYMITPDTPYGLNISCGIYELMFDDTDFDVMRNRANIVKKMGMRTPESSYSFYDKSISDKMHMQNELERDMKSALERHDFVLYVQPKYSLKTEEITGGEALVRWIHPQKGLIPPNDFIPLFEQNGFISKLDMYIFEEFCRNYRKWLDMGYSPVVVSVNLSRVSFHNENLANMLNNIAMKYNIPPKYIEVEITESAVFDNVGNLLKIIKEIRALGFPISIDDFGTGYSSLNLLKDLEVDVLKLDREFFNFGENIERSKTVVAHVIKMAKDLHIKTVSEGVETIEHVNFLKEIGCDIAQGYYYARPMPIDDFAKLAYEDKVKN